MGLAGELAGEPAARPVHVLVLGSFVCDLAFHVPARPGPGEVVIAEEFGTFRGGKGYNQAVAASRLGATVTMVGAVGADAYGDDFLDALTAASIDADRVVQLRGVSTAVAAPLITPDGEVGFVQHPGANLHLSVAAVADLPDCDVLLLQGEVNPGATERAAAVIAGRGGIVVLNPAPVHEITEPMLEAATVLCPNEVEARAMTGAGDDTSGEELAGVLARPGRRVAVTLGRAGAAWADGHTAGIETPPAVTAVDSTGAGDSFCAALGVRLAEGAGFADAVRFACAAGAHAATVRGAEPGLPTRAEVERLLG